jgi:type II secretion system protein F
MPIFYYNGRDKNGKLVNGQMEMASREQLVTRLHSMEIFPLQISETEMKGSLSLKDTLGGKKEISLGFGNRIKTKEITNFTRQLSDLLTAGLTLTSGLRILVNQTENPKFREVIRAVRDDVQSGGTLAEALARHPKVFNHLFISMIRAGELGGLLETVLMRLADFQEKEDELKGKILSALAYPMVMILVGSAAVLLLMGYVIPKFTKMFEEMDIPLPLPTQILVTTSHLIQTYWWLILLIVGGGVVILRRVMKSKEGKQYFDAWQLKIPVIGELLLKREIARFCRTFGELLKNGVNILQALQISSETMSNQVIAAEIIKIKTNVSEGEKLSDPLKDSKIFPPVVVNMIAVGEESGHLENVLMKIAVSFENDVDRNIKAVTSLFEPAIILLMGVLVGFIAISMLLPIFTINLGVAR